MAITLPNNKIIITCAITGGIHTPSMSAALPYKPEDIARQAIDAANAGAAIIHLHARDPDNGRPTGNPEIYSRFLPEIHAETNAVLNLTTGGAPSMSVEERLAAALHFQPEMCSLNMGSMNFGLFPMAQKKREWQFDWEKPYLEQSDDFIFRNTFRDIAHILELLDAHGVRYEHECYDLGHLYNLAHFRDRGLVRGPLFIQSVFGVLGGIGAEVENLMVMKQTADRLFGDEYVWSVLAAGRHQMPMVTQAALMGGQVRVGLEDSLYLGKGQLAQSNAQQVQRIRDIIGLLGMEAASPDEARAALALKGKHQVKL